MKVFPNKMIKNAYEKALNKKFTKSDHYKKYYDENHDSDYDFYSMQWLEDHSVLERKLNLEKFVYEYKIVK